MVSGSGSDGSVPWALPAALALLAVAGQASAGGPEIPDAIAEPAGPSAAIRAQLPPSTPSRWFERWRLGVQAAPTYGPGSTRWPAAYDAMATRPLRFGKHDVVLGAGVRGWSERPQERPQRWGLRVTLTFDLAR